MNMNYEYEVFMDLFVYDLTFQIHISGFIFKIYSTLRTTVLKCQKTLKNIGILYRIPMIFSATLST